MARYYEKKLFLKAIKKLYACFYNLTNILLFFIFIHVV
jgi:hypothetical protein